MNVEVRPYFVKGERYPALIGVRADGDEYEKAYVSKSELADALDENAKLRELVKIAVKHCDSGTCDGCPIQGESGSCPYTDMARELGVEVDE